MARWCSERKITPLLDPYDEFAVPYYVIWMIEEDVKTVSRKITEQGELR